MRRPEVHRQRPASFDLYDLDGDGELELIVSHLLPPAGPVMKVFKNGGTRDKPRWYDIGNTAWFTHHTGFGFRFVDVPPRIGRGEGAGLVPQ